MLTKIPSNHQRGVFLLTTTVLLQGVSFNSLMNKDSDQSIKMEIGKRHGKSQVMRIDKNLVLCAIKNIHFR